MEFVRSYFFPNEPLTSWTLFHQNRELCCIVLEVIKKCSTGQRFIRKEVTSYKTHISIKSIVIFTLLVILRAKGLPIVHTYLAQICYYDPWSVGISLQSPQSVTTPRILTFEHSIVFVVSCLYLRDHVLSGGCLFPRDE